MSLIITNRKRRLRWPSNIAKFFKLLVTFLQIFCLEMPSISKDSLCGFVGIQEVTRSASRFLKSPNFLAGQAGRRGHAPTFRRREATPAYSSEPMEQSSIARYF
jgi:hypothetical protein